LWQHFLFKRDIAVYDVIHGPKIVVDPIFLDPEI